MGYDETRDRQLFEDSAMSQQPTVPDRLRWLLQTFKYQKNIRIHAFNEEGMEPYPHGWDVWSNGIKAFMEEKGIAPNWIYTSEESDAPQFREHLHEHQRGADPREPVPLLGLHPDRGEAVLRAYGGDPRRRVEREIDAGQ